MFKMISYNEFGNKCETVNEQPAFYGLFTGKHLVGFFTTIEACNAAADDLIRYKVAEDNTIVLDLSEAK